jgi:uncharacterized protein (DUF2267 family)
MLRLGWQDRDKVYAALITALHALRDWLPRDEAISISGHVSRHCCVAYTTRAGTRPDM